MHTHAHMCDIIHDAHTMHIHGQTHPHPQCTLTIHTITYVTPQHTHTCMHTVTCTLLHVHVYNAHTRGHICSLKHTHARIQHSLTSSHAHPHSKWVSQASLKHQSCLCLLPGQVGPALQRSLQSWGDPGGLSLTLHGNQPDTCLSG
jgi:hypothetical protein